jgi:hypothetical protein
MYKIVYRKIEFADNVDIDGNSVKRPRLQCGCGVKVDLLFVRFKAPHSVGYSSVAGKLGPFRGCKLQG